MPAGRPCKYDEYVKPRLDTIKAWKRKGLTDKEIADNLGVGESTFRDYKSKKPALRAVLKDGKDDAVAQVENALHKRALGYDVAIESEVVTIEDPEKGTTTRTKNTIVHVKPDVAAMIFYLKNRKSSEWQDRRQLAPVTPDGKPLESTNVHVVLPDNGMNDGDK